MKRCKDEKGSKRECEKVKKEKEKRQSDGNPVNVQAGCVLLRASNETEARRQSMRTLCLPQRKWLVGRSCQELQIGKHHRRFGVLNMNSCVTLFDCQSVFFG